MKKIHWEAQSGGTKDEMAGMIIAEKYEVLECLGEGGFGNVYKVKDQHIDKIYAMKMQPIQKVSDAGNEIPMLKNLKHSGLPALHDIVSDNKFIYIVMEMAAGVTLEEYVKVRGKLSVGETMYISRKLCEIVGYLHSRPVPVIHGDLKPGNIMIDTDEVRLIDFGCALLAYSETKIVYGTPDYAAPESFQGEIITQSDVYSFGRVMLYMLTGRIGEHMEQKILQKYLKNYGIPRKIRNLLQKCLSMKPELRYPGGKELGAALNRVRGNDRTLPGMTASYVSMTLRILGLAMLLYCIFFYKYGEILWKESYLKEVFAESVLVILAACPWDVVAKVYYKKAVLECECSMLVTEGECGLHKAE